MTSNDNTSAFTELEKQNSIHNAFPLLILTNCLSIPINNLFRGHYHNDYNICFVREKSYFQKVGK